MSNNEDRLIRKAWEAAPPPEPDDAAWEACWESIRRTPRAGRREPVHLLRWMAFAAVFLVGLLSGVWIAPLLQVASRDLPATLAEAPSTGEERIRIPEPRPADMRVAHYGPPEPSDGLTIPGLRNVNVVEVGQTEGGAPAYRMTGQTARGVIVVWDYEGL